jgi:transcriptional regulator with XRE-family HTH domain
VGLSIHQPTLEENGLSANLDRLAGLLGKHLPDRIDLFWRNAMAEQPAFDLTTISGQLKHAIFTSDLTCYAIAKTAGISPGMITRFMAGKRDPSLETVDKLAAALGLRLRPAADDAAPDRQSPTITPEIQEELDASAAQYDNLRRVVAKRTGELDENEIKQKELLQEWTLRGLLLKEEYTEKLRKLNGEVPIHFQAPSTLS